MRRKRGGNEEADDEEEGVPEAPHPVLLCGVPPAIGDVDHQPADQPDTEPHPRLQERGEGVRRGEEVGEDR